MPRRSVQVIAVGLIGLLVVVLLVGLLAHSASQPASPSAAPGQTTSAASDAPSTTTQVGDPQAALTPGALNPAVSQATISTTICQSGWTKTIRPPASYTTALKQRQMRTYGYTNVALSLYEEDHLISLELGGAPRDEANLWPEPWSLVDAAGHQVGARSKDRFENYLRRQVCAGQLPLTEAQTQIAQDWVGHWLAGPESWPAACAAQRNRLAKDHGLSVPGAETCALPLMRSTSPAGEQALLD